MSHHGPQPPSFIPDVREEKFGATGQFPKGKLSPEDEGELRLGIAADQKNKKVLIDFGKSVYWIGFDPDQAREIARLLIEKADLLDGKT